MLSEKLRVALDNLLPDAGSDEGYLLHGQSLRDAAVLIAFTDRPDPGVILTQRPQWLRSHAGGLSAAAAASTAAIIAGGAARARLRHR